MTPRVEPAKLQIAECAGDMRPSGFKDWSYDQCYKFMMLWDTLETKAGHGEQAALSLACQGYGISYMDTEWIGVVEAIAGRTI